MYPDSAPANWLDILKESLLPIYISPLHEFDINLEGGPKKPHYHVIVCFDGPTTFNNVRKNFTDVLNTVHPKYILSLPGAYRYLCHLDDKDKYQYSPDDIIYLNGASLRDVNTISSLQQEFEKIENLIIDKDIRDFRTLVMAVRSIGDPFLSQNLRNNVYYYTRFLL